MRFRLVLDASVALKWYIEENDTREAIQLKDRIFKEPALVAVPELFFVESANVVWKKCALRGELSKIDAQEIFRAVSKLPFQTVPDQEVLSGALRIALKHSISVYDAVYLETAMKLDARFVTADYALVEKLKSSKLSESMIPLKSWNDQFET